MYCWSVNYLNKCNMNYGCFCIQINNGTNMIKMLKSSKIWNIMQSHWTFSTNRPEWKGTNTWKDSKYLWIGWPVNSAQSIPKILKYSFLLQIFVYFLKYMQRQRGWTLSINRSGLEETNTSKGYKCLWIWKSFTQLHKTKRSNMIDPG